jgi:hypothetical protein
VYESRAELDTCVAQHFDRFDYFVAPAHERTHWALGLGLPMFVLGPDIGPFAPLNHARLLAAGAAGTIHTNSSAELFGATLSEWRTTGKLAKMAGCGFGNYAIDGFARIADVLAARIADAPK